MIGAAFKKTKSILKTTKNQKIKRLYRLNVNNCETERLRKKQMKKIETFNKKYAPEKKKELTVEKSI
jgi:hypothetical protein